MSEITPIKVTPNSVLKRDQTTGYTGLSMRRLIPDSMSLAAVTLDKACYFQLASYESVVDDVLFSIASVMR